MVGYLGRKEKKWKNLDIFCSLSSAKISCRSKRRATEKKKKKKNKKKEREREKTKRGKGAEKNKVRWKTPKTPKTPNTPKTPPLYYHIIVVALKSTTKIKGGKMEKKSSRKTL